MCRRGHTDGSSWRSSHKYTTHYSSLLSAYINLLINLYCLSPLPTLYVTSASYSSRCLLLLLYSLPANLHAGGSICSLYLLLFPLLSPLIPSPSYSSLLSAPLVPPVHYSSFYLLLFILSISYFSLYLLLLYPT